MFWPVKQITFQKTLWHQDYLRYQANVGLASLVFHNIIKSNAFATWARKSMSIPLWRLRRQKKTSGKMPAHKQESTRTLMRSVWNELQTCWPNNSSHVTRWLTNGRLRIRFALWDWSRTRPATTKTTVKLC